MANESTVVGLNMYSPVSYFEKGPELGKPEFSVVHKNTTYHFTSAGQFGQVHSTAGEVSACICRPLRLWTIHRKRIPRGPDKLQDREWQTLSVSQKRRGRRSSTVGQGRRAGASG
jgi:hypothetical protein